MRQRIWPRDMISDGHPSLPSFFPDEILEGAKNPAKSRDMIGPMCMGLSSVLRWIISSLPKDKHYQGRGERGGGVNIPAVISASAVG